jgi:ureidoglycolate lyase
MSGNDVKMQLSAEPISAERFSKYGELLENKTEQRRRDFSVQFEAGPGLSQQLWVNRLPRSPEAGILVDVLECHPFSAQTFVPMNPGRCLVVVTLTGSDGKPDLSTLRAFLTEGGQGVSYRANVWHYAFTSLDGPNEVVVIMGYSGRGDDTVIEQLEQQIEISFPGDGRGG